MKHRKRRAAMGAAIAAGLLLAQAALAQDGAAAPEDRETPAPAEDVAAIALPQAPAEPAKAEAAGSEGEPAQLEDIVVTATKREKSMRDVPASISAFDGDKLEAQGKMNLSGYLQEKPGVTLTEISPALIRITIRGIATDISPTAGAPSPTGVLIGDTAFSDAYIANIQPDLAAFDLQSVEVLKGPQGTLFGGAALAGAIRYVLQEPVMGQWQARGFAQYVAPQGGSAAFSEGIAVNVPLYKDRLAARIGYVNRNYPGVTDWTRAPRQDDVDKGHGEQWRGILSWQPLDNLNLKYTHINQDYATDNAITIADTPDAREDHRQFFDRPTDNYFTMDGIQVAYDADHVRLISQTSRIEKSWSLFTDVSSAIAGEPPDGYPKALGATGTTDDDSRAFSQEFRLQSINDDGELQWITGVYYYKLKLYFDIFLDLVAHQNLFGHSGEAGDVYRSALSDPTSLLAATSTPTAIEKALFFDVSKKFWDRLELSAGARYYATRVHGGFHGTGVLVKAQNYGRDVDYSDNDITETGINPKFSATWHFTPRIATYVAGARGFRFGGLQSVPSTPVNGIPASYKSDTLWNYEWGWRTSWFDNTLQFDPTAFYISYDNPQIGQSTQGIPIGYTDNVGHAESIGFETTLRWLTPLPGLIAELNAGKTDAHTTVPFDDSSGQRIEAGAKLPGSAESQYSAALDFLAPPIDRFGIAAHVDYTYVGRGYANLTTNEPINDYGTFNAGIILTAVFGDYQPKLALNVANVLDETAVTWSSTGKPLTQMQTYKTYILNPPRTISLRLSMDF